jgi:PAS domain S-box-containing protein
LEESTSEVDHSDRTPARMRVVRSKTARLITQTPHRNPEVEMVQEKLIDTLLRAALEETGAQRGLLVLSRSGEHRVAAEALRRSKKIVVRLRDELADESLLPASVLHYVLDTRESVVIDDAPTRARFAADPYVHRLNAQSILCLPLVNQGKLNRAKLVGALLLETESASGIFTPTRIRTLKLVASLAASALENSRLYGDLREREAKMRRLVDANIIGIYIVDIRGPVLESNDAYLRMLGYQRADLVSGRLRWTDLTPPEWRAADKQRVERVKRIGRLQPFEKEFFCKDGTRLPVLMGVARFKQPRTEAVVFALDMSKQKQAEALALQARTIKQSRIARKMHDDMLQNFQGMMFRFQAARNLMTRHPDEARLLLNEAIKEGQTALDESRDAIQDLRPDFN